MSDQAPTVEPDALLTSGLCECCGRVSRTLTGYVHAGEATVAVYGIHWTVGHFPDLSANMDMIIGPWGETTTAADRVAVSLEIAMVDGRESYRVIDAVGRPIAESGLAGTALRREDVVGTPLAAQAFAAIDAIHLQDERLSIIMEPE
jgi:hypothetical protein